MVRSQVSYEQSKPQSWCCEPLFQEQSGPRLSPKEARGPWVAAIFPCLSHLQEPTGLELHPLCSSLASSQTG